ncbi:MAG: winged helix-turn-helix domain-containing protein [Anaerolineae bacterium]
MARSRRHLLLVEDTPQHQELMLRTLTMIHPEWSIDVFDTGEDALAAAQHTFYDAGILDFTLPGITGLEVGAQLRALVPDMPLVLVTARGSEKVAAQALRTGFAEYLIKEGDYLELLPLAIARAIETVEAAREREQMRKDLLRRTEELSALNAVSTAVVSSLSLQEILAEALGRTIAVLGAEAGAIYVVDSARRRASIGAQQGIDAATLALLERWVPSRTGIRRLMEDRRTITTLADIVRLESVEEFTPEELAELETFVATPLKASGVLMGVLCARPRPERPFTAAERGLLAALGRPIGMAMANAQLYQQTRQQLHELEASQERLMAAARATAAQSLASGIAGEINNALTSIRGSAQMILRAKGLSQAIESDALRILEGCERIARLAESLTSMMIQPEGRRAPHNVNRIIQNCLERLKQSTEALGIAVITNLAPRLPTVSIEGDALEQAIMNVLINAIEAMPNGGELRITTGMEGENVLIAIKDTGEGIPQENLPRIFDPNFTTRRDRGRVRGLGLGLFVTQNIVQSRGGTIGVRSEVSKGSTFTIRLPATRPSEGGPGTEFLLWSEASEEDLIRCAGMVLNPRTRQVAVGRGRIEGLTKMEARLLEVFMRHPNKILKRAFLMKEVWETDYIGDTRTLDVHVHWLRQKIEDDPSRPRLLRTIRGIGYRFGLGPAEDESLFDD